MGLSFCFTQIVVYYCSTYYMGPGEELGTCTQGAPVFPGSSRLGMNLKLQGGWCKTEPPAHRDLETTVTDVMTQGNSSRNMTSIF